MDEQVRAQLGHIAKEHAESLGPVKWCKKCSRHHRARAACDLRPVNGRWGH